MKSIKSVSVCGLGKLGACIAATFAARGFRSSASTSTRKKFAKSTRASRRWTSRCWRRPSSKVTSDSRATDDPAEAVATDVSFFIPPSPSLPDGSFSNEYLLRAMQPVAQAVRKAGKKGHIFVCSSTTTPGAMDSVLIPMLEKETGWVCGRDFGVCYNPEFIALGQRHQRFARAGHGADRRIATRPAARRWSSFTSKYNRNNRRASPACRSSARS